MQLELERERLQTPGISIEPRDQYGIDLGIDGKGDIEVSSHLLEKDLQQRTGMGHDVHIPLYMGTRPMMQVLEQDFPDIREEYGFADSLLINASLGVFFYEDTPLFVGLNTPRINSSRGENSLSRSLSKTWVHEAEHLMQYMDPTSRQRIFSVDRNQEIVEDVLGKGTFVLLVGNEIREMVRDRKFTRREFISLGVASGIYAAVAFGAGFLGKTIYYGIYDKTEQEAKKAANDSERVESLADAFVVNPAGK